MLHSLRNDFAFHKARKTELESLEENIMKNQQRKKIS